MPLPADCHQNTDPFRLVREGTNQQERMLAALDPAYAPVDEHGPAHRMVFARAYAAFLQFYGPANTVVGDWSAFFARDVSVLLAVAAIEEVSVYRTTIKEYFDYLNDRSHNGQIAGLKARLGYLFSAAATLARQLDDLQRQLPPEIGLRASLQNQIRGQLAGSFRRLLAYYRADESIMPAGDRLIAPVAADMRLLGAAAVGFDAVRQSGLSANWITDGAPDWPAYLAGIAPDASVFGSGVTVFERINHIATHNLFTAVFDQFLKGYARTVRDAQVALAATFTDWDRHAPHYALFLSFLRLYEHARLSANTLTGRHLDFYYRRILRMREKAAQPGHAHLLIELTKNAPPYELVAGTRFKAGKDEQGRERIYTADRTTIINPASVAEIKTVYRHQNLPGDTLPGQDQRLFAAPVADSDDGLGAELTNADQSWHPFFHKQYLNGQLSEIRMPTAEVGFALASHYLFLAEGERTITLDCSVAAGFTGLTTDRAEDLGCFLTTEEGWLELTPTTFKRTGTNLQLSLGLSGSAPPITAYDPQIHGYAFTRGLPVLRCQLRHRSGHPYRYAELQDVQLTGLTLTVDVVGHKSLVAANDFGPVDTARPFQPFGALPTQGSSFIVGAAEVMRKNLLSAALKFSWKHTPAYYSSTTPGVLNVVPTVDLSYLKQGVWTPPAGGKAFSTATYDLSGGIAQTVAEDPGVPLNEAYRADSRQGYVRLLLKGDLGFAQYQKDLGNYLTEQNPRPPSHPGNPVLGPFATGLSLDYTARQTIPLNSAEPTGFAQRAARFYQVAPFGQAEQHPLLRTDQRVFLLPQFEFERAGAKQESEAELYIGIQGLQPPQHLSLLFQAVDGTADPLSLKPDPHLHWSYLSGDEWHPFQESEVEDHTAGLLQPGIIRLAVPRAASAENKLLTTGLHWLRVAVAGESDAVARLQLLAAQALRVTFEEKDNSSDIPPEPLAAGTISKLERPVAAVKKVSQPFAGFGGRGREAAGPFYTRVSERLRHKDRALVLWDYERLVLEAFPEVYKVRCLNHTRYEPTSSGAGIYRELAPGHVTLIALPNLATQQLRDPLRPYTSLAVLQRIEAFLRARLSCFVQLHVRNPRFEEVRVSFRLRLYAGFDESFYRQRLREAITRFLSPWAFSRAESPTFGGKIYKSVLINFVEEQPYVDYVTDFQLFHDLDGVPSNDDRQEIEGSTAVSVLVSVPASEHTIELITPAEASLAREKCDCET